MVSRQFQHPTLLGLLEEKFKVHRLWEASEPEEFIKNHCQGAGAMVTDHFGANEQLIQQFPKLKCITNFGVGFDAVAVDYASKKGIQVTNTPDVLRMMSLIWPLVCCYQWRGASPKGTVLCVRAPGRKEACGSPKVSPGRKSEFWEWEGSGRPLPNVPRLSGSM